VAAIEEPLSMIQTCKQAKKYAQAARTDLEKAKSGSDYYEVYYQRMSALATTPELLALQAFKDVHQNMLAQPRVRPSPTPEFSGTPSPTPTSTPFKKKAKEKHKSRKCTSNVRFSGSARLPPLRAAGFECVQRKKRI
jgi:hypothetical protein